MNINYITEKKIKITEKIETNKIQILDLGEKRKKGKRSTRLTDKQNIPLKTTSRTESKRSSKYSLRKNKQESNRIKGSQLRIIVVCTKVKEIINIIQI